MDKLLIFVLEHLHEFEDGHEDSKLLGLYSSQEKAEAGLERVRDQPGFRDHPEGFSIEAWEVDSERIAWPQGFVTVQPGET